MRSPSLLFCALFLIFAPRVARDAQAAPATVAGRPAVDESAMSEAIRASIASTDGYASSGSYAHFFASRMASQAGDHRAAIHELQLALATDEGSPFLITALAEEYLVVSEPKRAEAELRTLLRLQPGYQAAHILLGRVLLERREFTEAMSNFRHAIKLKPSDPEAFLFLAQLHLEMNAPDLAVKLADEMAASVPEPAMGYKRIGLTLAERGDLGRAEKLLKKCLENEPDDSEALGALGQIYQNTQRFNDAIHMFERAIEQDPENPELLLAIGVASIHSGAKSDTRAYFDRLLQISDTAEYVVRVVSAYLDSQMTTEAAQVLDEEKSIWARDPRVAFYSGLVHARLHHYRISAEAYEQIPRDSQLFPDARLYRASSLSLAGDHGAAIQLFQEALKEKPDHLPTYPPYSRALERMGKSLEAEKVLTDAIAKHSVAELIEALAAFYERAGKAREAVELLRRQLSKHPGDETLLYALGMAYQHQGDLGRSIAQMREILKVNPINATAMNFIGYSLVERGKDLDEAEKLIRHALQIRPDNAAFLDSLGWLYFRRGEFRRAVLTLEQAVALEPDQPLINEHLGDAYRSATNKSQAAAAYRRALDTLKAVPELQEVEGQSQGLERKLKMLSLDTADR